MLTIFETKWRSLRQNVDPLIVGPVEEPIAILSQRSTRPVIGIGPVVINIGPVET
ncbi:2999_t:CDS:2 [Acaulospora morrowiae]|uniref:2999_t:CDS:1 n=1 Tax=Acaulospora morrowiae TaxID=94023 RepID=A0A9N8V347_9GLOM|nr:2999_t:CDS:2 [Acaulospora morrowiae]